ncbi:MAG: S-layer homology domain-containing protein [Oscillospiraceae bacterium]|nr:S-layer homology domain-containing protein [Oscillospiraceae bacterium]
MKKSLKQIISALLVLALFASLGFSALAVPAMTVSASKTTLTVGETATLSADCSDHTNETFTYTSDNETVAKIEGANTVKAYAIGTAKITATCSENNNDTATTTITVKPKAPTVTGETRYILSGTGSIELKPQPVSQNGTTGTPTYKYQWKDENGVANGNDPTYKINSLAAKDVPYEFTCDICETVNGVDSAPTTVKYYVIVKDRYELTVTASNNDPISVNDRLTLTANLTENVIATDNKSVRSVAVQDNLLLSTIVWTTDLNYLTLPTVATGKTITATARQNKVDGVDVTAKFTTTSPVVDYTGTYKVRIQDNIIVTLNGDSATLLLGSESDAPAVVANTGVRIGNVYAYPANASNIPANAYTYTVTYTSDDPSIASVTTAGRVKALKAGATKIKVHVEVKNSSNVLVGYVDKECNITVVNDNFDIVYNVKLGGSVTLSDNVFGAWFKNAAGSSYALSYVRFGTPSNNLGYFRNGTAYVDAVTNYYTSGNTGTGYKYLANTIFTAPANIYRTESYVAIPFTCFGGTSAASSNVSKSGMLYFFFTYGEVTDITYDVTNVQSLLNSDFLRVYRTATGESNATACKIKLLDLPKYGSFYKGYVNATNMGAKVTATGEYNVTNYDNSGLAGTIGELTYVPASARNGTTDTVHYAAYSSNGELLYVAGVVFKNGVVSYDVYSEGRPFVYTDFYKSTDADPIVSVSFEQPAKGGRLFINYKPIGATPVKSTDVFYTKDRVTGQNDISTVTFIPDVALKENAEIKYTATTRSGATYTATITMKPKSRTSSSYFGDVTPSKTGNWSANAIDFAYKWELVKGTSDTARAKMFSPEDNMTRAQLVTILYRTVGSPVVSSANPFKDVKNDYYYNAVIWAYANNIVKGTSATTFDPDGKITREQIAAILYRFDAFINNSNPTGGVNLYQYTDNSKVSSYAVSAMGWAVGNGIITSAASGTLKLDPSGNATRAQVSTMLHRYLCKFD